MSKWNFKAPSYQINFKRIYEEACQVNARPVVFIQTCNHAMILMGNKNRKLLKPPRPSVAEEYQFSNLSKVKVVDEDPGWCALQVPENDGDRYSLFVFYDAKVAERTFRKWSKEVSRKIKVNTKVEVG